jgi:hypothetical protein
MIQSKLKESLKMSISLENQKLIMEHKKQNMGDNFIMRALKKHKQIESGVVSSHESSIDEDAYRNAMNENEGNRESMEEK